MPKIPSFDYYNLWKEGREIQVSITFFILFESILNTNVEKLLNT